MNIYEFHNIYLFLILLFSNMFLDLVTRAQAIILRSLGETLAVVQQQTGITPQHIRNLHNRAKDRGWKPGTPLILDHVKDKSRCGRPTKITPMDEEAVINAVLKDRYGREKTVLQLASQFNISSQSVLRILHKHKFRKTKPTRKPGLSRDMRTARYLFAQQHQHWTLDDWKSVIWTDETSVVLGHRRGSYRVWRRANERCVKSCIRERWKGYSEFMFWGSFTYDFKGPCHIWRNESTVEKKSAVKDIECMNLAVEREAREEWYREMQLRGNKPGRKPQWRFTVEHGAFARATTGGIDWYRYLHSILLEKLLPFAMMLKYTGVPNVTVMEDKAPSHASKHQRVYYEAAEVQRLIWPGNSPDLNMIESCWGYLKRVTTKKVFDISNFKESLLNHLGTFNLTEGGRASMDESME